jgi:FkbM family methyltransferase
VTSTLEALSAKVGRLKTLDDQIHTRVSFLTENESGMGYFCWTDDGLHRALQQTFSEHRVFDDYVREMERRATTGGPKVFLQPGFVSPLAQAIEPLLAVGQKVHLLDVGCYYGVEDCLVAGLLEKYGDAFRITGFDPGWAGRLAPFNLELNKQTERVGFEPLAMGWHDGAAILYGEYGQCENSRTVNRMVDTETFSFPCRMTRLDTYVAERGIRDRLFLKVDIQGGEYQALQGAAKILQAQCAGLMIKFIPHALAPMITPGEFLTLLPPRPYRMFRIPYYQLVAGESWEKQEISPESFKTFAVELQQSKVDYCYLLVVFGD